MKSVNHQLNLKPMWGDAALKEGPQSLRILLYSGFGAENRLKEPSSFFAVELCTLNVREQDPIPESSFRSQAFAYRHISLFPQPSCVDALECFVA